MKGFKRFAAVLLTLCMLVSMLPTTAFAAIVDGGDWGDGEEGWVCPNCGDSACPGCGGDGMCPVCYTPYCLTCGMCPSCGSDPMCPECGSGMGCMYCGDPACTGECMQIYGWCGDSIEFHLDATTGNLRIYGSGEMWDGSQEWCSYYVNHVDIEDGITSIGDNAFSCCYDLYYITIPASMERIGEYAFESCGILTNVDYYGSARQWSNISMGSGNECLTGANITYYGVDDDVIGGDCGDGLSWELSEDETTLTITGTGTMESWTSGSAPWYDYADAITRIVIEAGVESLGDYAFAGFTSLVEITIPDSVTSIGIKVFFNCTNIVNITIPESVTNIGDGAFSGCTSLVEIVIPEGVTSIGIELFYNCTNIINITIPESVDSIGDNAFEGCTSLVEIKLPEGLTSIGIEVFYNCTNIINITIPEGVTNIGDGAFKGCTSLVEIVIPEGVESIGIEVFYNCTNIVNITIPEGVTSIGDGAFKGCTSLVEIVIPDSVESIGVEVFYNCTNIVNITIPEGVESIGDSAFQGCTSLVKVILPDSLKTIGIKVFYNCTNIINITIPEGVTSIGNNAFNGCSSLVKIVIPEGVTNIGVKVFYNCTNLINITIPQSVESVGEGAFSGCEKLETVNYSGTEEQWEDIQVESDNDALASAETKWILAEGTCGENLTWVLDREGTLTISGTGAMTDWSSSSSVPWYEYRKNIKNVIVENGVTTIGSFAFCDFSSLTSITIPDSVTYIGIYAFSGCASLTSITIPDSVTTIGNNVFYYCTSLTSVTIGDSVTTIGDHAFYECTSLTSITIPDSVTTIGDYAFSCCVSLTSITIPDSVTTIGDCAFYNCRRLESITISAGVTTIGSYAFSCCSSLTGIWVDESNPNYSSDDYGVLLNKEQTNIIEVPEGLSGNYVIPGGVTAIDDSAFSDCGSLTSITIPDSVTYIGIHAFSGCASLTSITIPDSVTTIGDCAFYNCRRLESITIPDSVTYIGDSAFSYCDSLTKVYYSGTQEQWAQVSIDENNDCLTNAKIYTTDTLVTGIAVNTLPEKTEYWIGEALDATGLTLIATYQDGHTATITEGFATTSLDSSTEGKKTITVIYEEKTATFEVTVKKPVVTELIVATMPNKTEYWTEEYLDTTGLVLTAIYSDGSTETVTEGFSAAGFSSALAGEKTVTVTYKEGTTTFTVTVKTPELLGITVATLPQKTQYWVGEELVTTGLTLTASYSNGTEKIIRSDFSVSGFESETEGEKTVTVNYEDKTTTFTVTVIVPVLTGIEVATMPKKTGYWVGEELETTGLTLLATYSDGRTKIVTEGFTVSGFDSETEGEKTLTVTYEDQTTTFNVTVVVPVLTSIAVNSMPVQTSFWIGQSLNTTGLSILATYNDGRNVVLTEGFTLSGYENTTAGDKIITVTYEEMTTQFTVLVKEPVLTGITIHASTKREYWVGEEMTDLFIYAYYSDGNSKRVTEDYTVTGFDTTAAGARVVTVTYQEKVATFTITVKIPVLTGIAVHTSSTHKTEYFVGEELDVTGLTLIGTYSDGSAGSITEGFTVSGFDSTTAGEKTVTVTYEGKTAEFTVTVKQNVTRITVGIPAKTEYWVGEELDTTGLLVTAYYADGSSQVITEGYTISGFDSSAPGKMPVKITYAGLTATFATVTIISEASGTCGSNATWTLNGEGTLTVSGTGDMYNYANRATPWNKYLALVKNVVVESGITYIGKAAFMNCTNLTSVQIANTVTGIGDGAFYFCRNLAEVTIPDSVVNLGESVFAYCDSLKNAIIGNSTVEIKDTTFLHCVNMTAITLPRSVTAIGDGAFYGCDNLSEVYFKGTTSGWEKVAISTNNEPLTNATFQISGVLASGSCGTSANWAMYDNGELIISGTGKMYDWANRDTFWKAYNSSITKVTIEDGVTYIGKSAFRDCSNLTSIRIPVSVTSVGVGAFETATALKTVNYGGAASQWQSITINSNNNPLTKATVKYVVEVVASGKCGASVTWTLYNSGELVFSGVKGMYDWANRDTPWNAYNNIITKVTIEDGVTNIGKSAFRNCTNLASIQIPKSVTTVGIGAFETTTGLKNVTYVGTTEQWANVTVNSSNDLLTNATVTTKLTEVASGTCGASVNWTLYDNGELAFTGTKGMYDYATRNTPWNDYVDSIKIVTVDEGVTKIGKSAFRNCSKLTDIRLSSTVTSIGTGAFEGCNALKNIVYVGTTEQWAKVALNENSLTGVTVVCTDGQIVSGTASDKITWVLDSTGTLTFSGTADMYNWANRATPWDAYRDSIKKVVIGSGITSIGDGAFRGCSNLTDIEIADTVIGIGDGAFRYCTGLLSIVIPDQIVNIGDFVFTFCTNLTSITLGSGLTEIGDSMFGFCSSLTDVTMLGNILKIGNSAFEACNSLSSITIPGSVQSIGISAFGHCDGLTDVYFDGASRQWAQVAIADYNESLTSAKITFKYCDHLEAENGVCTGCNAVIGTVITDAEGNVIGNFTSLSDALAAAAEGQTLSLQSDAAESDVILASGVSLDLNGHTLTADSVLTYSSSAIIDTSENVSGLLKIAEAEGNMISQSNSQLPVYDKENGGYRFFAIDVTPCAVTGKKIGTPKYWFKVKAEKFAPLYELIHADADLQIKVKMTWDGQAEDVYAAADLAFTKAWADSYNANEDIYITVSVAEAEGLENFKLIPMITSGDFLISGNEM